MKKSNKTLLTALVSVILISVIALCAVLFLGSKKKGEGWSFEDDTLTVTCDSMESWQDEIPWEDLKPEIKEVDIEDNVQDICKNAFADCTELESVRIGKSVKSIGEAAFKNCSKLNEITIPESVEAVEAHAFSGCRSLVIKLENTGIPSGFAEDWCDADTEIKYLGNLFGEDDNSELNTSAVSGTDEISETALVTITLSESEVSETAITVPDDGTKTTKATSAVTASTAAKKSESDWTSAYKKFLKNYDYEKSNEEYYFALIYVTNDDIPEIAICDRAMYGSTCEVFTYYNGNVCKLGDGFGVYGDFNYVERKSLIIITFTHAGIYHNTVYTINNSTATEIFSSYDNKARVEGVVDSKIIYRINDKDVDSNTYYQQLEENIPSNYKTCCPAKDGYKCTDSNFEKYIK